MSTIGIVYYSMYGHTFELAQALAEGVANGGGDAQLRKVPETLPEQVRAMDGVRHAAEAQAEVGEATVDELGTFDGILFGSPTRFGNRVAQLSNFLDQTGPLWAQGTLLGKPAGFFTGASTMHGGHEATILTMSTYAYHHGMVIVPPGYALGEAAGATTTGGGPYGPSHLSPQGGDKDGLSAEERDLALAYGEHFHAIAERLRGA